MMQREQTFVSAVVYLRNDAASAKDFIHQLGTQLDVLFEHYEIVAVDDCSRDGTIAEVKAAKGALRGALSIVALSFPQGMQRAMNAGVDLAIGDFVYEFESCCLDFPLDLLKTAYITSLAGNDIVSVVPEGVARLSSRLFYGIFNRYSGSRYPLTTDRFRLVSRRAINRVQAMSALVTYRKACYMGCGLKSEVLRYTPDRSAGGPQADTRQRRDLALDSLILFTDVFYKISFALSILMMALAVFIGAYAVIIYASATPVEGWTTTTLFLSLGFFGVFAVLTIVLKYLSILLGLVFQKQSYTIESVTKL